MILRATAIAIAIGLERKPTTGLVAFPTAPQHDSSSRTGALRWAGLRRRAPRERLVEAVFRVFSLLHLVHEPDPEKAGHGFGEITPVLPGRERTQRRLALGSVDRDGISRLANRLLVPLPLHLDAGATEAVHYFATNSLARKFTIQVRSGR